MAFYDVAGGMRMADVPSMVQAGIRDGRTLREVALYNQHGQGIMNNDAASMAELAAFDPVSATSVRNAHESRQNAAATRAEASQKHSLEAGLQMAGLMARAQNPEDFNRTAAWLADHGMAQARDLIGRYEEAMPMFQAVTRPENAGAVAELQSVVSMLPPDQQQQAFNMGLTKLATGTAMVADAQGRLVPASRQEQPGLRMSVDANGNQVIEYGNSDDYNSRVDRAEGANDATTLEQVMVRGTEASGTLARLDVADRAFAALPSSGLPWSEFVNQNLQAFSTPEQQRAISFVKNFTVESALDYVSQTKGAISNAEMQLFMAAAPGMGNTREGNLMLVRMQRAIAQREVQQRNFFIQARNDNVPLNEIRQMWTQYVDENPLFSIDDLFPMPADAGGSGGSTNGAGGGTAAPEPSLQELQDFFGVAP